jgi:hypothetical protein
MPSTSHAQLKFSTPSGSTVLLLPRGDTMHCVLAVRHKLATLESSAMVLPKSELMLQAALTLLRLLLLLTLPLEP